MADTGYDDILILSFRTHLLLVDRDVDVRNLTWKMLTLF